MQIINLMLMLWCQCPCVCDGSALAH